MISTARLSIIMTNICSNSFFDLIERSGLVLVRFSQDGRSWHVRQVEPHQFFHTTPENLQVLALIDEWVRTHRMGPTLREVADGLGVASHTTAQHHVHKLLDSGLLTCDWIGDRKQLASRTLRLTTAGLSALALWDRIRAARLLLGERELALDAQGLAAARRTDLPLHLLSHRVEQGRTIICFENRYERDQWAWHIAKELPERDAQP